MKTDKEIEWANCLCSSCGALNEGDFKELCRDGCPTCGSQSIEIYTGRIKDINEK